MQILEHDEQLRKNEKSTRREEFSMIKEVLYCDQCNKQSNDICGDPDWIKIEPSIGSLSFSISNGRPDKPKDSTHKSKVYKTGEKTVNFCSVDCMLTWLGIEKTACTWCGGCKDINENEMKTINISYGMEKKTAIEMTQSDLLTLNSLVNAASAREDGNGWRIKELINNLVKK